MKRLWLYRHAKTAKHSPSGDDADRRLTEEGRLGAEYVGGLLGAASHLPNLVLVSPARRTRATAEIALGQWQHRPALELVDELYLATSQSLRTILADRTEDGIMLIAHNPGLEDLVSELGGRPVHVRPGQCIVLDLQLETWAEIFGPIPCFVEALYEPNNYEILD